MSSVPRPLLFGPVPQLPSPLLWQCKVSTALPGSLLTESFLFWSSPFCLVNSKEQQVNILTLWEGGRAWSSAVVASGFLSVAGKAVQNFTSFPSLCPPLHCALLHLDTSVPPSSALQASRFPPVTYPPLPSPLPQEEAPCLDSRSCRTRGCWVLPRASWRSVHIRGPGSALLWFCRVSPGLPDSPSPSSSPEAEQCRPGL